jgi:hypothetical protein
VAPTYPANPGPVTLPAYVEASPATEFLGEVEHQLLLIEQAIELIAHVFSWILILLSINYLTDLFSAIYLLMAMKANDSITIYVVYIIEALCFLFLTHNLADVLSDAVSVIPGNRAHRLLTRVSCARVSPQKRINLSTLNLQYVSFMNVFRKECALDEIVYIECAPHRISFTQYLLSNFISGRRVYGELANS